MTVWLDSPKSSLHRPATFWAWWLTFTSTPMFLTHARSGLDVSADRRRGGPGIGARASDVEWGVRWLPSQPAVLPPLHPGEMAPSRPSRRVEGAQRNRRAQWRVDRRVRDCGSPYRVERRSGQGDRRAKAIEITDPRILIGRFNG